MSKHSEYEIGCNALLIGATVKRLVKDGYTKKEIIDTINKVADFYEVEDE